MLNDAYLSNLAEIRLGHPFRGAIEAVADGTARVVQIRDLTRTSLKDPGALMRTQLGGRKAPDWLRDNDVLFVAKGTSTYATPLLEAPERAVCSQQLYVIRLKDPARVLPTFLAWQLNQAPVQRYLRQSAEGSHHLSIRRSILDATTIRIPPLEQQHTIVALDRSARLERDAMHALIQNRESELAILAERLLA